jgi:transmembrane sensor
VPERRDSDHGRELLGPLRQLDRDLSAERLSPAAEQRLQRLVREGVPRSRRVLVPALVAAAAAAAVLLVLLVGRPAAPPPSAPARVGGFEVVQGEAAIGREQLVGCASASCTLRSADARTELVLARATRIRRRGPHLQLASGRLVVEVQPRPRKEPLRVYVSHGVIEVLGTRFTLWQGPAGGRVQLHRGSIRFLATSGEQRLLRPGAELAWPLPPPVPPRVAAPVEPPPPPSPPARRITREMAESLLDAVERLRSQGRYREAVRRLQASLPHVVDRVSRERLSFELGTILTHHLRETTAACRHWRRHLARFGRSRYGDEIDKARRQLGCPAAREEDR